jgi:hypothetical protein
METDSYEAHILLQPQTWRQILKKHIYFFNQKQNIGHLCSFGNCIAFIMKKVKL